MKNVVYCIFLLLLAACSSSNPEVRARPTLSAVELTVRVGETAVITVNDAENVSAKVRDEAIAIIDVSSNKISLLTVILCPAMSMSLQRKNRHHQNRKKTTRKFSPMLLYVSYQKNSR